MKRISIFIAIILISLGLISLGTASQATSFAQQKQPQRPRPRPKKPSAAKPKPTPTPDMRAEASQVAMQIKNVSNFIFIYGKIVNSLQIDEDQVKRQETSPEIQTTIKKSKAALLTRIRDLRAGLEELASRFESNPRLQIQYLKLTYAADASRDAEDLAARGQYEEAGRSLVTIVERLADAIISMRLP